MSSASEATSLLIESATISASSSRHHEEGDDSIRIPMPMRFSFSSIRNLSHRVWGHMGVGSMGMLGSMSIAVNFLTGPAMLEIPAVFQKSGLIPTVVTIVCTCLLAALCSLHMASSISKLPGNTKFSAQVEYSHAFSFYYWPDDRRWFVGTQLVFYACVTCLNISSLVDSAQVFDTILANLGGGTYALQITLQGLHVVAWDYSVCSEQDLLEGDCIPFSQTGDGDDDGVIFTAGYALNILCFMPLALMNLKVRVSYT